MLLMSNAFSLLLIHMPPAGTTIFCTLGPILDQWFELYPRNTETISLSYDYYFTPFTLQASFLDFFISYVDYHMCSLYVSCNSSFRVAALSALMSFNDSFFRQSNKLYKYFCVMIIMSSPGYFYNLLPAYQLFYPFKSKQR